MKIHAKDDRHIHTHIEIRDGERVETVVWGDMRSVYIVVNPGEVPNARSGGFSGKGTLFAPETAHMEWKRNRHYEGHRYSTSQWSEASEGWVLTNAGIRGTNIKADGTLGKLNECLLFANEDGYGIRQVREQPEWYAALFAEYDPNRTGSLLDQEPLPAETG